MGVTQPAWRQEVLSDATRVRIANNYASIGHAVLLFPRSRIYVRRDRVVQTRFTYTLQVKRTSASNAPTFKYRDSYAAASFGRVRVRGTRQRCSGIAEVNIIARQRFTRRSAVQVFALFEPGALGIKSSRATDARTSVNMRTQSKSPRCLGDLPWPHFRCDRMRSLPRAPTLMWRSEGEDAGGI